MNRKGLSSIAAIVICLLLSAVGSAEPLLIPVGETIGLQLRDDTVTIAAFDDKLGIAAKNSGLKIGDRIVKVNGKDVRNSEEIQRILDASSEETTLTILRGSKEQRIKLKPTQTDSGVKLGLYLKQGITGIGTVTWYDPEKKTFGALGHGVNDSSGVLLRMTEGTTYRADVQDVIKGKCGHPGQLKGNCGTLEASGILFRNTPQGVFGKTENGWKGEPIPICSPAQVHTGQASIRSTVNGCQTNDYSVEILKVYSPDRADGRNLLLRVTDQTLLESTGGIVQGMSGSPIVQDGRFVGAVTHVLVNDPTLGYGIFIENMLDSAA